jgi:hypothetical protein
MIGVSIGLIKLSMSLNIMPGYATWITLASFGGGLASSINMGGDLDLTAVISESLNNGKKELSAFYMEQAIKYWAFILFAMAGIIVVLIPILNQILFMVPAVAEQYSGALLFVVPGIIAMIWDPPSRQLERAIVATGKVWFKSGLGLFLDFVNLGVWVLLLYRWQVWEWGTIGIIIMFSLAEVPAKAIKLVLYIVYVQRNVMKIRISWYQSFGASLCTFFTVYLIGLVTVYGFLLPLLHFTVGLWGPYVGTILVATLAVLIILIGFMIFVFPFSYAIFGGWDEFGLETLRKSYMLSGPSRPFIKVLYNLSVVGSKISPLYNKFKLDWSGAFREAEELLLLKRGDESSLKSEIAREGHVRMDQ